MVVIVLLGVGVGILISYALTAHAEVIKYEAPIEEPVVIVEKTIEEKIREEFTDAPIMIQIARCESGFKNVPSRTGDYGPFQINQVHLRTLNRLGLDRTNVDDNISYARYLYNQGGTSAWYMSRHCWNK